jgi:hypothetical protein
MKKIKNLLRRLRSNFCSHATRDLLDLYMEKPFETFFDEDGEMEVGRGAIKYKCCKCLRVGVDESKLLVKRGGSIKSFR